MCCDGLVDLLHQVDGGGDGGGDLAEVGSAGLRCGGWSHFLRTG